MLELVLASPVVWFSAAPVQLSFVSLLVILLGVVGLLSRGLARRKREAARTLLELHAWPCAAASKPAAPRRFCGQAYPRISSNSRVTSRIRSAMP